MSDFKPYPWHEKQMMRFRQAFEQQRLPHAILLTGPEGTGKLHLARCLTHYVLEHGGSSSNFEYLLEANSHPDVTLVEPEESKKQISVGQIRDLTERLALTTQLSAYKIAIIHPAQSMNRNAANALLKTLEEPQGNSLLILITHNHGLIPQTILSRCQQVHIRLPEYEEAMLWLREQGTKQAEEYLQLAGGAPLKAVRAAQQGRLQDFESLIADLSRLLHTQENMVSVGARWHELEVELLVSWLLMIVQSLVKLKVQEQSAFNITANLLKLLKISHDQIDLRDLIQYSDFLNKTRLEIDNNLNQELMFEQIFSRWAALKQAA